MLSKVVVVFVTLASPCISNSKRLCVHLDRISLSIIFGHNIAQGIFYMFLQNHFVILERAILFYHFWILDKSILDYFRVDCHFKYALVATRHFYTQLSDLVKSAALALGYYTHFDSTVSIPIRKC